MTDREKAIVMAYTGYAMLTGDKLGLFYQYIQEKVGRPVMTHELAEKQMQETIHTLSKPDFVELCRTNNEPVVLTLEEVKSLERDVVVWYEHDGVNKQHPRIVDQVYDSGIIFTDGGHWRFNGDAYGKKFRLWTARPTDAQREATPWA